MLVSCNGRTKTARLWIDVRDDRPSRDTVPPAVWLTYSPDRNGIHLLTHLAQFEGVLQADAYAGFNALFKEGTAREAACGAYARRKSDTVAAILYALKLWPVLLRYCDDGSIEINIRRFPAG